MMTARQTLATFTEEALPGLDVAVLGALELFEATPVGRNIPSRFKRPLVIGSVNAHAVGRILYEGTDAVFADESSFEMALKNATVIDGAVIVSASGGKHATGFAQCLYDAGIPAALITNNEAAPAAMHVEADATFVFPKNREPYTYNTSTYLGMILAKTGESPAKIRAHLSEVCTPTFEHELAKFSAFTFILPREFGHLTRMVRTKFDELFGPFVLGRAFTEEEIKHAKTVVTSEEECFIALGVSNEYFGAPQNRIALPLPDGANYGTLMALSYYCVGLIQRQLPPYFARNIGAYVRGISKVFGEEIPVIVE